MYQVDNDVVLLDADSVEVLPDRERELLLRLTLLSPPTGHRGRLETDAPGLREDEVVVGLGEGGGCVEVIFAAVGVEELAVEGGPLDLDGDTMRQSSLVNEMGVAPRNGVGRGGEPTLAGSCCVVVALVAAAAAWLSRAACWLATRRILTLAFEPFSLVSLSSGALRDVFVGAIGAVVWRKLQARGSWESFEVLGRYKGVELHGRALAMGEGRQKAKRKKCSLWDCKLHGQERMVRFLGSGQKA